MAVRRADAGQFRDGSYGGAPRQGSFVGADGEDGSQGRARDRPTTPDGLVPPCPLQVAGFAIGAGAAGGA
jgi:hypothetical protein